MHFKRINRIWLAFVISFMLVLSSHIPAIASINSLTDIANQAVIKQYEEYYDEKTPVDSSWGNIEAYDAYILSKAGVKLENWTRENTNFKDETLGLVNSLDSKSSAKHLAGGYLVAKSWGETKKAHELLEILQDRQKNEGSFDNDIYSNLPAIEYLGRAGALSEIDVAGAVYAIINAQYDNGAFGATYDGADYFDVMLTSQAVRSLQYLKKNTRDDIIKNNVNNSINNSLDWLRKLQLNDGSFLNEAWDDPVINTVEVLVTLKTLGIEPSSWQKNGKSGLDYILAHAPNPNGTIGMGTIGNNTAIIDLAQILNDYKVPSDFYIITLNYAPAEIIEGRTIQLEASKFYLIGNREKITEAITWTSDASHIATVENGLVAGVGQGSATITATYGDLTAKSIVKVGASAGGGSGEKQGVAYLTIKGDSATGTILSSTSYLLTDGDISILDMLKEVLDKKGISYKTAGGYLREIKGFKEKKPGYPLSGWKFKVNGVIADKGAGAYLLKDGDRIEWYYTLDYTKDEDASRWGTVVKELEAGEKITAEKVQELLEKLVRYNKELKELDENYIYFLQNINRWSLPMQNLFTEYFYMEVINYCFGDKL